MRKKPHFMGRHASAGVSLIELALILPVLLILLLGVADFARAILFTNILVNMSREGANLASRTTQSPQYIIDALNHTATPLQMETEGMIYIARVKGVDGGSGTVVYRVEEQYRATSSDKSLVSRLWTCPSWATNGSCNMPAATADRIVTLPMPLTLGEEVRVVETIYDYLPFSNYVMKTAPDLYSWTLL